VSSREAARKVSGFRGWTGLAVDTEKTSGEQKTTGGAGRSRQPAVGPARDCDRGGVGALGRISRLQSHCWIATRQSEAISLISPTRLLGVGFGSSLGRCPRGFIRPPHRIHPCSRMGSQYWMRSHILPAGAASLLWLQLKVIFVPTCCSR